MPKIVGYVGEAPPTEERGFPWMSVALVGAGVTVMLWLASHADGEDLLANPEEGEKKKRLKIPPVGEYKPDTLEKIRISVERARSGDETVKPPPALMEQISKLGVIEEIAKLPPGRYTFDLDPEFPSRPRKWRRERWRRYKDDTTTRGAFQSSRLAAAGSDSPHVFLDTKGAPTGNAETPYVAASPVVLGIYREDGEPVFLIHAPGTSPPPMEMDKEKRRTSYRETQERRQVRYRRRLEKREDRKTRAQELADERAARAEKRLGKAITKAEERLDAQVAKAREKLAPTLLKAEEMNERLRAGTAELRRARKTSPAREQALPEPMFVSGGQEYYQYWAGIIEGVSKAGVEHPENVIEGVVVSESAGQTEPGYVDVDINFGTSEVKVIQPISLPEEWAPGKGDIIKVTLTPKDEAGDVTVELTKRGPKKRTKKQGDGGAGGAPGEPSATEEGGEADGEGEAGGEAAEPGETEPAPAPKKSADIAKQRKLDALSAEIAKEIGTKSRDQLVSEAETILAKLKSDKYDFDPASVDAAWERALKKKQAEEEAAAERALDARMASMSPEEMAQYLADRAKQAAEQAVVTRTEREQKTRLDRSITQAMWFAKAIRNKVENGLEVFGGALSARFVASKGNEARLQLDISKDRDEQGGTAVSYDLSWLKDEGVQEGDIIRFIAVPSSALPIKLGMPVVVLKGEHAGKFGLVKGYAVKSGECDIELVVDGKSKRVKVSKDDLKATEIFIEGKERSELPPKVVERSKNLPDPGVYYIIGETRQGPYAAVNPGGKIVLLSATPFKNAKFQPTPAFFRTYADIQDSRDGVTFVPYGANQREIEASPIYLLAGTIDAQVTDYVQADNALQLTATWFKETVARIVESVGNVIRAVQTGGRQMPEEQQERLAAVLAKYQEIQRSGQTRVFYVKKKPRKETVPVGELIASVTKVPPNDMLVRAEGRVAITIDGVEIALNARILLINELKLGDTFKIWPVWKDGRVASVEISPVGESAVSAGRQPRSVDPLLQRLVDKYFTNDVLTVRANNIRNFLNKSGQTLEDLKNTQLSSSGIGMRGKIVSAPGEGKIGRYEIEFEFGRDSLPQEFFGSEGGAVGDTVEVYANLKNRVYVEPIFVHTPSKKPKTSKVSKEPEGMKSNSRASDQDPALFREFRRTINMSSAEIDRWRKNPQHRDASLPHIRAELPLLAEMKRTPMSKWTPRMWNKAMRAVNFVKRHEAQMKVQAKRYGTGRLHATYKRIIGLLNWGRKTPGVNIRSVLAQKSSKGRRTTRNPAPMSARRTSRGRRTSRAGHHQMSIMNWLR